MKNRFLIIVAIFLSLNVFSQSSSLTKADKDYNNYAYIDAIAVYEKVAEKGHTSSEMLKKLGNSYYFNANLTSAAKWYEQLIALDPNIEPEYFYRYSQCLKALGDYKQANEYLEKFASASSGDSRSQRFVEDKNYLDVIKNNSNRYTIEDAGINTEYSDYGGTFYNDEFVFTTARDTGNVSKNRHTWTNESFSNLYGATVTSEGSLIDAKKFSKTINSKLHESSAVFTKDGNTMYFTRNNYLKGKKGANSEDVIMLKLYKAENENGKWTNIVELPFNSDQYNVAHPSLSIDGKTLYFASDMPGTLGMSDIFKVAIKDDGSFGKPENLGNVINSEGRETFPYFSDENELFFASDGHLGLGGLDIFVVKYKEDGSLSNVFNVGTPVNSSADDFAYIINNTTKVGFFTSNRDGGKGNDDIYKFKEESPLPNCKQSINGVVTDQETGEVLQKTLVTLLDENMNIVAEMNSAEDGKFAFLDLECDKQFFVRVAQNEYETIEKSIVTSNKSGDTYASVTLDRKLKKIEKGTDLAKTLNIPIIYFDLDKSNIRKDAAIELAKIVEVLKQNPTLKIDVRSHTDSRQTANYNANLSEKRAKSTVKWLVKNGIEASRLTGSGYGESQLVNECADGVECSEEQHQQNRRSEFIIIEM
jgi:outer membrane protein OmpA-like peptidoglycan-associated protein/tetratricopeptide (TPR) repeat protein